MNKKELLDKKLDLLTKVYADIEHADKIFEQAKNDGYSEIVDEKLHSETSSSSQNDRDDYTSMSK